jgi:hypothetical protein
MPWLKPAVGGAVIGAVVVMILGFSWLGWTLGSTAERIAEQRAESAVIAALTPMCVAKFNQQPNATAKLAEFQKINSWEQAAFVEKGGWATMPGSSGPNSAVARACAEALLRPKT